MAPSYRLIDYRLRPAKHAERLMLCEAFRRIRFHHLEDYQYVGLGSVFFADFRLMHRILGIKEMYSIEKQVEHEERFEWNKPYSGINLLMGTTETRLSDIDFSRPTIIWLDYDGPLDGSVIGDIRSIAHAAHHGLVLAVSVNAQPRRLDADGRDMLEQVSVELGNDRIPAETDNSSLFGWGLADFYRRIGDGEIRDALSTANGVRRSEDRIDYEQIFNFRYEDGAKMLTFGGVFCSASDRGAFDACAFDRLDFVRRGKEGFRINSPKLTLREISHLERQLPLPPGTDVDFGPMPQRDAEEFIRLYRYLPAFLPVDLF